MTISLRIHWRLSVLLVILAAARDGDCRAGADIAEITGSKSAIVSSVDLDEVRWTAGFWASRVATCYEQSIPSMWRLMETGQYKPFLEHFLIAAGDAEGDYHGAQWNDGDFYKWLEAAIADVAVTGDQKLQAAIDRSIKTIANAQRADGYLHTPVLIARRNGDESAQPFQDRHAFEMYNMGHLLTTACLHHRLTGQTNLLDVAEKAAGFLIDAFRDPTPALARNSICPSHYMGTIDLYRTTGDPRYLKLATTFLEMRKLVTDGDDDNQDRVPLLQQRDALGHAVRANYLYAGVADYYAETGAPELLPTLEAVWGNMARKKMYITGACGALYDGASPDGSKDQQQITRVHQAYGRNYQLPNITAHNETCANIGNLMWSWRMFQITGDAKYVDVLETALYNSVLSGVSLSGTEYFYVNPLRVVDPLPTNLRHPRTRQPFFVSFCCPPNVVRTIAQVGAYAYSKSDDAVWVNLYGENELATEFLGRPLRMTQKTAYPWDGRVRIVIDACPERGFGMMLRIPRWAGDAKLRLNEKELIAAPEADGYVEIKRNWQVGDVVELKLPMQTKLMQAHPLVEETSNQVAVQRGPTVYCLESPDLPTGVDIEDVRIPMEIELRPRYDPNLLGGVTVLEGTALAAHSEDWGSRLYREATISPTQEFLIRLVPYYSWANRGPSEMTVWMSARD